MSDQIAGYTFGGDALPRSPVSLQELDLIKATLLWTDEDDEALRRAGEILADKAEEVVAGWYEFVGGNPHLVEMFAGADGEPDERYLERVRQRFVQWIHDTCNRPYDQSWLDYQHEISLRHTPRKKNVTDEVDSPADHVPLRYLIAFVFPLTATVRPFLQADGHPSEEVDAMYHAWFKAVTLTASLWAEDYSDLW